MIKIIKELNIDVTKPNVFQAVVAKQYDMNSRFLKVTLTDCGNVVAIPYSNDIKVVISAERADGQSKGFDGEVNEDGTVTVPLHSWMLELEGLVKCDISVIETTEDNNKKLTTTSFDLMVEKAAYGGEDVTTDPQYDVLVELIERVENIEAGVGGIVDQTYDATSPNAQSGKAVAEAIKIKKFTKVYESGEIHQPVDEWGEYDEAEIFIDNLNLTKCLIVVEGINEDNNFKLGGFGYIQINDIVRMLYFNPFSNTQLIIECDVEDGIARIKYWLNDWALWQDTTSVKDVTFEGKVKFVDKINKLYFSDWADFKLTVYGR